MSHMWCLWAGFRVGRGAGVSGKSQRNGGGLRGGPHVLTNNLFIIFVINRYLLLLIQLFVFFLLSYITSYLRITVDFTKSCEWGDLIPN